MSLRLMSVAGATILATGLAVIGSNGSALAHERRAVATNYLLEVGFLNEPSVAYQPNGLSLSITFFPNGAPQSGGEESEGQGDQGTPVEGADQTLKAEVIVGGNAKKMDLKLEPAFGQKGSYEAHFIPTAAGDYTFRIFGTIQGQNVDEKFDSGPNTFGPMEDPAGLEFPNKVPSNADLQKSISDVSAKLDNAGSGGDSDTATALAIIGIIAGVVGIGVGGYALASRRRA